MREKYIIGIDQSTQGTKAILLNASGEIAGKTFLPHEQIVNGEGWVSHDAEEIFRNVILTAGTLIGQMAIDKKSVAAIGISNQRETTVAWDRETGKPVEHAIVWQCARAKEITAAMSTDFSALVQERTGIPISPYFPAAKAAWIMQNNAQARKLAAEGKLCIGTIDAWLVYKLSGGKVFRTDYSDRKSTRPNSSHTDSSRMPSSA